jgi:hypothetical protein
MNNNSAFLALVALDLARERSLEAERDRLVHSLPHRPGLARRGAARIAAALSLAAAGLARRLDDRAFDGELRSGGSLA